MGERERDGGERGRDRGEREKKGERETGEREGEHDFQCKRESEGGKTGKGVKGQAREQEREREIESRRER